MKAFKIRVEDTTNGEVTEFESDCVSVISIADDGGGSFTAKIRALRACPYAATLALIKALERHMEDTERQVFKDFLNSAMKENSDAYDPKENDA